MARADPTAAQEIFCLGQNYLSHAKEAAGARERELKIPEVPVFFTKAPTTVTGPYDAGAVGSVRHRRRWTTKRSSASSSASGQERRARAARSSRSSATRSSTTCRRATCRRAICSGSRARASTAFARWVRVVVTADEFGDPQDKRIVLRLNGDVRQNATTADMIFSVAVCLE